MCWPLARVCTNVKNVGSAISRLSLSPPGRQKSGKFAGNAQPSPSWSYPGNRCSTLARNREWRGPSIPASPALARILPSSQLPYVRLLMGAAEPTRVRGAGGAASPRRRAPSPLSCGDEDGVDDGGNGTFPATTVSVVALLELELVLLSSAVEGVLLLLLIAPALWSKLPPPTTTAAAAAAAAVASTEALPPLPPPAPPAPPPSFSPTAKSPERTSVLSTATTSLSRVAAGGAFGPDSGELPAQGVRLGEGLPAEVVHQEVPPPRSIH